ncbi:MAG: hypothetical protein WB789_09570 [Thermoplasmata archaeon]
MCDVDELEFAEYLQYVKARMAPPIPGESRAGRVPRTLRDLVLPSTPVEA